MPSIFYNETDWLETLLRTEADFSKSGAKATAEEVRRRLPGVLEDEVAADQARSLFTLLRQNFGMGKKAAGRVLVGTMLKNRSVLPPGVLLGRYTNAKYFFGGSERTVNRALTFHPRLLTLSEASFTTFAAGRAEAVAAGLGLGSEAAAAAAAAAGEPGRAVKLLGQAPGLLAVEADVAAAACSSVFRALPADLEVWDYAHSRPEKCDKVIRARRRAAAAATAAAPSAAAVGTAGIDSRSRNGSGANAPSSSSFSTAAVASKAVRDDKSASGHPAAAASAPATEPPLRDRLLPEDLPHVLPNRYLKRRLVPLLPGPEELV
jgi:hypothetical protein